MQSSEHDSGATGADEFIDTVVDFGVYMIGAACQHDDGLALGPGFVDDLLPLLPHLVEIMMVSLAACLHGLPYLLHRNAGEIFGQDLLHLLREILFAVQAHIIGDQCDIFGGGQVAGNDLWIIGDDRAVVVVIP